MSTEPRDEILILSGILKDPHQYWPQASILKESDFLRYRTLFGIIRQLIERKLKDGVRPEFSEDLLNNLVVEERLEYTQADLSELFESFHESQFVDAIGRMRKNAVPDSCAIERMRYDVLSIKERAKGHWPEILKKTCGLTERQVDPRQRGPCPICDGKDRFRALDDVVDTGALFCNQCFREKNGDGFAAIMWLKKCSFPEAVAIVADEVDYHYDTILQPKSNISSSRPKLSLPSAQPKPALPPEHSKSKKIHGSVEEAADAFAWGIAQNGLLPEQQPPDGTWRYFNADGSDAGVIFRWNLPDNCKTIRQASAVPGGWVTSGMPEPRPLYRLPDIVNADVVWICEGEKSADVAVQLGLQATTSSGGSGAAEQTDWRPLDGKRVIILPDNDDPGDKYTRAVVEMIWKHAPDATVEVKLLKDNWPEIPEGGDIADWEEQRDTATVEMLRDWLNALPDRIAEYQATDDGDDKQPSVSVRTFGGKSAADLWDLADQPVEWLVDGVFSVDQPTVIGAKQKSLKTTLLTDLAVSLASGLAWLKRFDIPSPRRVLFVTGESSEAAAIRKVKRAAECRNLRRQDLAGNLRIEALTFPNLPSEGDCAAIAAAVREHSVEVVILDPLYMGLQGVNTANLTEVGPALRQFMASCRPAKLIIAHHVKKSASFDDAPNLEDLSQAGIAEFAGNYWLMGRMNEYAGDGVHQLAIRYGGRDEQFGLLKLDFNERDWTAGFSDLAGHREDRKVRQETERSNKLLDAIRSHLRRSGNEASLSALAEAAGTKATRESFQRMIDELCASGHYVRCSVSVLNNRSCPGLKVNGQIATDTVL